jgi:hypothetical protein
LWNGRPRRLIHRTEETTMTRVRLEVPVDLDDPIEYLRPRPCREDENEDLGSLLVNVHTGGYCLAFAASPLRKSRVSVVRRAGR